MPLFRDIEARLVEIRQAVPADADDPRFMGILAIDQDDLRPGWLRVQVYERAEGRRQAVFLKRCPWGRHNIRFDSRSGLRACTRCGVRLTEPTARASAR